VLAIVTANNAGRSARASRNTAKLLGGPDIDHYHQAVALVVAETFEQARAAAALVRVDYAPEKGAFDLRRQSAGLSKPSQAAPMIPASATSPGLRRCAGPARCALHDARSFAMR
jgi:xanthine dehydrogenase YagR molybdenum-binding subunit